MQIKLLTDTAVVPTRATAGSAGYDLYADKSVHLQPNSRQLVNTGIAFAINKSFVGMICPRSGLANKKGVTVLNAPGIIDSDYRGEVKVLLYNSSMQWKHINKGDRIAQIVFVKHEETFFIKVDSLTNPDTRSGGFGHTGE